VSNYRGNFQLARPNVKIIKRQKPQKITAQIDPDRIFGEVKSGPNTKFALWRRCGSRNKTNLANSLIIAIQ